MSVAAQTVRRAPGSYAALVEAERSPAPELVDVVTFDRVSDAHPAALAGSLDEHHTPHGLTELALTARSASPERIAAGTAIDAGGLLPDTASINSWTQRVHEVDAMPFHDVDSSMSTLDWSASVCAVCEWDTDMSRLISPVECIDACAGVRCGVAKCGAGAVRAGPALCVDAFSTGCAAVCCLCLPFPACSPLLRRRESGSYLAKSLTP